MGIEALFIALVLALALTPLVMGALRTRSRAVILLVWAVAWSSRQRWGPIRFWV